MRYGRPSWQFVIPAAGNISPAGFTTDVTLQLNQPNQNFTIVLISASTGLPLNIPASSVSGFATQDGSNPIALAGVLTAKGNGVFNYSPTQTETSGNCLGFIFLASGAVATGAMFLTAGGLRKNVSGQIVVFALYSSTTGAADTTTLGSAVSVNVSQDNNTQTSGGGTVSNLGNKGLFSYAIPPAETNGTNCSYEFLASGDEPVNYSIFTRP